MFDREMRALFLALMTRGFGEVTTAIELAENVNENGGEVCFLASPHAAGIVRSRFQRHVSVLSDNLSVNQKIWRQTVRDFNPNIIVFSETYDMIFPASQNWHCPLIDFKWLQEIEEADALLVWMDCLGFSFGLAHDAFARIPNPPRFLRSLLERLRVILPCPLHDPGGLQGRRGIPYRSTGLPLKLARDERARVRSEYLGAAHQDEGILVLHTTGSWLRRLAERLRLPLYHYLSNLLAIYLADVPRPVTMVDIDDRLPPEARSRANFRVVNLKPMALEAYDRLLLSSDLVLSENLWSNSLPKALGNAPAMVLLNSYTQEELWEREDEASPVGRLLREMDRRRPGGIYPHYCYPLPVGQPDEARRGNPTFATLMEEITRAGLVSEVFLKAELYDGEQTRELFRRVLCDPSERLRVRERQMEYVARQSRLPDGVTVLQGLLSGENAERAALDLSKGR
jgi:hypothetical protein